MVTRLQCGGWDVEVTAYVSDHNGHTYATILLQHYATGEVRHVGAFDLTTGTPLRRAKEVTRKWKP